MIWNEDCMSIGLHQKQTRNLSTEGTIVSIWSIGKDINGFNMQLKGKKKLRAGTGPKKKD